MRLIHEGVAQGHRMSVMVWCMLAADAIGRFDGLGGESWILGDARLGGVPRSYLVTLVETSRLFQGRSCDRVEVAYLLSRCVTADALLIETATCVLTAARPAAFSDQPEVSTAGMIEAVRHLGVLRHDQLVIAHHLAATWQDGPATLAAEVKIRSAHGGGQS